MEVLEIPISSKNGIGFMRMHLRTNLFHLAMMMLSVVLHLSDASAQNLDPTATINLINAQQNFVIQQQQLQMQAAIEAQNRAAEEMLKQQQFQAMSQMAIGACSALFKSSAETTTPDGGSLESTEDLAYNTQVAAWDAIDKAPYTYGEKWNREEARAVGADSTLNFGKGCDKFMNRDGQLGPWGQYALSLIKEKPEAFGDNVPDDISQWCPKYKNMKQGEDVSKRELYWVWILMSMASSESSCDPRRDNPNAPDGVAKGLFQVWKPVCPKARNLSNPYENIQCAVDLLAKEMGKRDTIMTPTSKGREGTYWGPLRSDDWNKRRGGDIRGAQKTRAIMSKYRYCH